MLPLFDTDSCRECWEHSIPSSCLLQTEGGEDGEATCSNLCNCREGVREAPKYFILPTWFFVREEMLDGEGGCCYPKENWNAQWSRRLENAVYRCMKGSHSFADPPQVSLHGNTSGDLMVGPSCLPESTLQARERGDISTREVLICAYTSHFLLQSDACIYDYFLDRCGSLSSGNVSAVPLLSK